MALISDGSTTSHLKKTMYEALTAPIAYDFLVSLVVGLKVIMRALKFINPMNLRSFVMAEVFYRSIIYKEMFKSLKISTNSSREIKFLENDFDVGNFTIGDLKNRLNLRERCAIIAVVLKNIPRDL